MAQAMERSSLILIQSDCSIALCVIWAPLFVLLGLTIYCCHSLSIVSETYEVIDL